ncbi:MAG: elongation factor Ts [Candidatus Eremiobacteraeota bacterium]|nr:elongation factor Ts [Candidatus Eremiobacteraeota bacterium]
MTTTYQPSPSEIKALRDKVQAPMMDCRIALIEANGDTEQAQRLLLERGQAQAAKKAERTADEGLVASYIHPGGKIGVLVELNSETDFVARSEKFVTLARDIAMHVAAMSPLYIDRESVPADVLTAKRDEFAEDVPADKKPEIAQRIVDGKLRRWYEEHCLVDQPFVKDDTLSVGELIAGAVGILGERIVIRRFARFALGDSQ